MIRKKTQAFNDGVVRLHHVKDVSQPGETPREALSPAYLFLRYREKTVGVMRHYTAMREGEKISLKIRCPRAPGVSALDVAILPGGIQYRVRQRQFIEDVSPPVMDLSLERMDTLLEVDENGTL